MNKTKTKTNIHFVQSTFFEIIFELLDRLGSTKNMHLEHSRGHFFEIFRDQSLEYGYLWDGTK